jgi:hypothetical protein
MAANVLNILGKLTKKPVNEQDLREETMASTDNAPKKKKERPAKKNPERAAQRAQKRAGRAERKAARKGKRAESGKSARLCSLATVEVKKASDGFHVSVNGSAGRKAFTIAPNDASQVLRDLETAIQVMRGQV